MVEWEWGRRRVEGRSCRRGVVIWGVGWGEGWVGGGGDECECGYMGNEWMGGVFGGLELGSSRGVWLIRRLRFCVFELD